MTYFIKACNIFAKESQTVCMSELQKTLHFMLRANSIITYALNEKGLTKRKKNR